MRLKHRFKPIFIEKDVKIGLLRSISSYRARFYIKPTDISGKSVVNACFLR